MLMVLLGWTFAAIFRSGPVYGSVLLRFGQEYLVRSVAYSRTWDARQLLRGAAQARPARLSLRSDQVSIISQLVVNSYYVLRRLLYL